MIVAEKLINFLKKKNLNFFTGVPDSILKKFSHLLDNKRIGKHIIAVNEGSAVALGVGYYLSTKKTIVTPSPPSCPGGDSYFLTKGCVLSVSRIAVRSAPVPFQCI